MTQRIHEQYTMAIFRLLETTAVCAQDRRIPKGVLAIDLLLDYRRRPPGPLWGILADTVRDRLCAVELLSRLPRPLDVTSALAKQALITREQIQKLGRIPKHLPALVVLGVGTPRTALRELGPFDRGPADGIWTAQPVGAGPVVLVDTRRLSPGPGTSVLAALGRIDQVGPEHVAALMHDPCLRQDEAVAILEELMHHQRSTNPSLLDRSVRELLQIGRQEGHQEGREVGRQEGRRDAALRIARATLDPATVASLEAIEDAAALERAVVAALAAAASRAPKPGPSADA